MKKVYSFILFFCFGSLLTGQIATDFTVTDVEGETHNLFSYLNDGKHVVLNFLIRD